MSNCIIISDDDISPASKATITLNLTCVVCQNDIYNPDDRIHYTCGHFLCRRCHLKWNASNTTKIRCHSRCEETYGQLHITQLPTDLREALITAADKKGLRKKCEDCNTVYYGTCKADHIKHCKKRCLKEMCYHMATTPNGFCSSCTTDIMKHVSNVVRQQRAQTNKRKTAGKKQQCYSQKHLLKLINDVS